MVCTHRVSQTDRQTHSHTHVHTHTLTQTIKTGKVWEIAINMKTHLAKWGGVRKTSGTRVMCSPFSSCAMVESYKGTCEPREL